MLAVGLPPCDDHLVSVADIRVVFRALAEARNKDFYNLCVLLTRSWPKPLPKIEFRIYPVAESTDARVVVRVAATRPDGTDFDWGLAVTTQQDSLFIEGSVDMRTPEDDWSEVFSKSRETTDPEQAASLIRAIASEVCSQRQWLSSDSERGFGGENMTEILRTSEDATRPWLNITPIANFLVNAGNIMVDGGFGLYQDGWRCRMEEPLDLDGVRRNFDLPDTILLSKDHDTILDKLSWCSIEGPRAHPRSLVVGEVSGKPDS